MWFVFLGENCRRRFFGGEGSHYCSQNCKISFTLRHGLANVETSSTVDPSRLPKQNVQAAGLAPARLPKRKSIRFGLNLLAGEQE